MFRSLIRSSLLLFALFALGLPARAVDPPPDIQLGEGRVIHGAPVGTAKAPTDTTLLMGPTGSGAPYIGDFEGCDWHGWTSRDVSVPTIGHWQVSAYNAVGGALSAWCGDPAFPSCDGGVSDPDGGYGNDWDELLEWRGPVADPGQPTTVTVTATLNVDTETAYDFVYLSVEKAGAGIVDLAQWDGVQPGLVVNETVTIQPAEYVGGEVVVLFRFVSDGAWSDEDCSYPSAGAFQLDDVSVSLDNGTGSGLVDFEDGQLAPWTVRYPDGVGDFAQLWRNLDDLDPCRQNATCQVAFIDDGVVVPGTGGSPCIDHCYGPMGWTVNVTGGLAGPDNHLHNVIESPVMPWPDPGHTGMIFSWDRYEHFTDAGVFATWNARWTTSADPDDILSEPWNQSNFLTLGGPSYSRRTARLDHRMPPAATYVQVQLGAYELGWVWGWTAAAGTPAPYFDNARVVTYAADDPGMRIEVPHLAQSAFPENGTLDMADPGALSVRFDMAQNIAPASHLRIDRGDSLVLDAVVMGAGRALDGPPQLHYKLFPNPVFDPYRTSGLPNQGQVAGGPVTDGGVPVPDRWFFDLPDTSFLYPGDKLHYFFTATSRDTVTGATSTTILPADTTHFSPQWAPQLFGGYDRHFTFRALPTIRDLAGTTPEVLFWNDAGNDPNRDEWSVAFAHIELIPGRGYDVLESFAPSSGHGNGLGGLATLAQLAGYEAIVYTSGTRSSMTLGDGDFAGNPSDDLGLLTAWLDTGDRGFFATGDNLVSDLLGMPDGMAFAADVLGVDLVPGFFRDLVGGQTVPRVSAIPANPIFTTVLDWTAYGGCPGLGGFDAVTPVGAAVRLAEFRDPADQTGAYPYSAATLHDGIGLAGTSAAVSLPYGFQFLYTDPEEGQKADASLAARTRVLRDVLFFFGISGGPDVVAGLPDAGAAFAVAAHPNPFNPTTTLRWSAPRPGRLELQVFDLRGRLVRTVLDRRVTGPGEATWDGTDDRGAQLASGVYFYRARLNGKQEVGKLTLVK